LATIRIPCRVAALENVTEREFGYSGTIGPILAAQFGLGFDRLVARDNGE
jgi:hypothetical protein